jgi:hypothetical protein
MSAPSFVPERTARSGPEDVGGVGTAYGMPVQVKERDDGRPGSGHCPGHQPLWGIT